MVRRAIHGFGAEGKGKAHKSFFELSTGGPWWCRVRNGKPYLSFFIGMDRRALEVSGAVCRGLERIGKHNKVFLLLWIA